VAPEGHENKSSLPTLNQPLSGLRLGLEDESLDSKLNVGKGDGLTYVTKQEALQSIPQIHTGTPTKNDPAPAFTDPNLYPHFQNLNASSRDYVAGTSLPVSHLLSPTLPSGGDNSLSAASSGTGPSLESSSQHVPPSLDECNDSIRPRSCWQSSPSATFPTPLKLPLVQKPEHRPPISKVVGGKNVPGEGLCAVFEDGSYIQKSRDGEMINPYWGVTKTGKPRKRLAIACMTCREKKIKCDPGELKCVQCDQAGSDCRWTTHCKIK